MSHRELVILGTSSQVPTRTRNHNSLFLAFDGLGLLFDPGEGTQRQMLFAGISASQITHIAITHFHGDHCLGLPGIIQRLSLDQVEHEVTVFFPEAGKEFYERLRYASSFFDAATIRPHPLPADLTRVELLPGRVSLTSAALEHSIECIGYRLDEKDTVTMIPEKLEHFGIAGKLAGELKKNGSAIVNGSRVKLEEVSKRKPGQSVAVVMDTRPCSGASTISREVDFLVCESTYRAGEAALAGERFHMTSTQAAELARDSNCKNLILTHFSPRYQELDGFLDEAREVFENTTAARDLTRVSLKATRSRSL